MSAPPFFVMPKNVLFSLGLPLAENTFYQLSPDVLTRQCIERKKATADDIVKHTGGISNSRFIVKDKATANSVDWNNNNQPLEEKIFDGLYQKMIEHLGGKNIWIRDSYVGADAAHRLYMRSISEGPESDLFVYNMFLHPTQKELENFNPDWYIIHTPTFSIDIKTDSIEQDNFIIINFTKRIILIGGLAYTDKIKKEILSILNRLTAVPIAIGS